MSNAKQNAVVATSSKFSIVRKISEFLKLGDDGKLDSFFTKIAKTLAKEVSAHKKNLDNLKFNHEQKIDELEDSLEDAESALAEAFLKVDIERIGNNASQAEFQEIYLANLDTHELAVQRIEKEIEKAKEKYNSNKEDIDKAIKSLEKRIKTISAE